MTRLSTAVMGKQLVVAYIRAFHTIATPDTGKCVVCQMKGGDWRLAEVYRYRDLIKTLYMRQHNLYYYTYGNEWRICG